MFIIELNLEKNVYFIILNVYFYSLILGLKCIWKDIKIIFRIDIESFGFFFKL